MTGPIGDCFWQAAELQRGKRLGPKPVEQEPPAHLVRTTVRTIPSVWLKLAKSGAPGHHE